MAENTPWYQDGLRFECHRCGNCCTGAPGSVSVTDAEVTALADHLAMTEPAFRATYTRDLGQGEVSLREKANLDCVFFDRAVGCTVYAARPTQCRTWPFWRAVVRTPAAWAEAAKHCHGMNQGARHDASRIRRVSDHDGTVGPPPSV
jgi:Fe-S-cluster containining protein